MIVVLESDRVDPFGLFSTFDNDQLANIHRHYCREVRFKISKLAKYESDMSKASENMALQSREILQTFV